MVGAASHAGRANLRRVVPQSFNLDNRNLLVWSDVFPPVVSMSRLYAAFREKTAPFA